MPINGTSKIIYQIETMTRLPLLYLGKLFFQIYKEKILYYLFDTLNEFIRFLIPAFIHPLRIPGKAKLYCLGKVLVKIIA